jgi:hypothetical protein
MMDYFDALRENGWLADPTDRVRVGAVHQRGCGGPFGGRCVCSPQLVMGPTAARDPERDHGSGGGRMRIEPDRAEAG